MRRPRSASLKRVKRGRGLLVDAGRVRAGAGGSRGAGIVTVIDAGALAGNDPDTAATAIQDPHSFARPSEASVRHLATRPRRRLRRAAAAGHRGARSRSPARARPRSCSTPGASTIEEVRDGSGAPARFELGPDQGLLGRPLRIALGPETDRVVVRYRTSPEATALQWLEPRQTAGGKQPFLFTQSQAILARTWIPLQDTPSVRFTYDATIRVPPGAARADERREPTAAQRRRRLHVPHAAGDPVVPDGARGRRPRVPRARTAQRRLRRARAWSRAPPGSSSPPKR